MKNILTLLLLVCTLSVSAENVSWLRYPSISPDGEKIAFSYNGDIYIVDSEGGQARQITSNRSYD